MTFTQSLARRSSQDAVNDVVTLLTAMRQVRYVGITAGTYDIVIEALFRDNDDFRTFLTVTLGTIEGLRETETSYVLEVAKRSYRIGLAADVAAEDMSRDDRQLLARCRAELGVLEEKLESLPSSNGRKDNVERTD